MPDGRVTENQARWHEFLRAQGYAVEVCRHWQDAAQMIEWYMGVPKDERTVFYT
jgi:hypothetical protein